MKGKVNCTCGWSWNKSDSSAKDMYICHECGRDNSNNMKNGGWLDNIPQAQEGIKSPNVWAQEQHFQQKKKQDEEYEKFIGNTGEEAIDIAQRFTPWKYLPGLGSTFAVGEAEVNNQDSALSDELGMIPFWPAQAASLMLLYAEKEAENFKKFAENRDRGKTYAELAEEKKIEENLNPKVIDNTYVPKPNVIELKETKKKTKKETKSKKVPYTEKKEINKVEIDNTRTVKPQVNNNYKPESKPETKYKFNIPSITYSDKSFVMPREVNDTKIDNTYVAKPRRKNGGWLDNYNDSQASAPEGMIGDGYSNVGRDYSPAWGGQFQMGGNVYPVNYVPQAQEGKTMFKTPSIVENDIDYNDYTYSYPEREPYSSELEFLKTRPDVGGMATEDNHVIINPYSPLPEKNKNYVRELEQARLAMRNGYERPTFKLTPKQEEYFSTMNNGKPYSEDLQDIRETIASRILVGDETAQDITKEQQEYADKLAEALYKSKEYATGMKGMMKSKIGMGNAFEHPAIKRMSQAMPKTGMTPEGIGTHYMSSVDNYAVPELQDLGEEKLTLVYPDSESREAIRFNSPEEAEYFAKHYKEVAPMSTTFRDLNSFQSGGSIPGSVGFTYARTKGIPSNGPYAKKTMASAKDGGWLDGYDVAANGTTTEETTKPNKFAIVKSIIQDKKNGKSPFDLNTIYDQALKNTQSNAITKKQTEDFIKKLNVDTNQTKYKIKNETEEAVTKIDNTAVKKTNFDKDNKTYNNANTKEYKPEDISNLDIPSQVINQIDYVKYHDNPTQNFGVVDKENNVMYYVNQYGQIIGHENVVTGATNADKESAPSMLEYGKTANEYYDYLKNTNQRVTPTGKFTLHSNDNTSEGKPHSLWDRAISALPFTDDVKLNTLDDPSLMHALYNEMPWREEENKEYYDHRKESYGPTGNMFRMVSQYGVPSSKGLHGTGNENRIAALNNQGANKNLSNGCINVNGKTMCFDILKDKSNLYILPEKEMETPTSKAIVKNKEEKYPPFYDKDKKVSREDIQNVKNTKAKISKIISDNNIKATPEEIEFATAVAQKETKGGESWGSKAESILPGFSSYGLYEQKESFPYLKGKSPNDESASTQAIIDFYRDMLTKYPELNNDSHKNEKLYSTYNSGRTDWNTNGIYHALEFRKISQALNEYKNGGGIIDSDRGQWDHPGEITRIKGGNITMKRDPKTGKALTQPILGIADTGEEQWMYPGEDYNFEGANYVTEYPKGKKPRMAKNGLRQEQKGLVNLDNLLNFTNYNTKQPGGWLDTL